MSIKNKGGERAMQKKDARAPRCPKQRVKTEKDRDVRTARQKQGTVETDTDSAMMLIDSNRDKQTATP